MCEWETRLPWLITMFCWYRSLVGRHCRSAKLYVALSHTHLLENLYHGVCLWWCAPTQHDMFSKQQWVLLAKILLLHASVAIDACLFLILPCSNETSSAPQGILNVSYNAHVDMNVGKAGHTLRLLYGSTSLWWHYLCVMYCAAHLKSWASPHIY